MLRKLNYGAAREGQKQIKATKRNSRSEKSGGKSRSVNETGSKVSYKQEEAKGKAQEV